MNTILKFLFPAKTYVVSDSVLLLATRIIFGLLLMSHGVVKWENFGSLSATFPDPLGVGSHLSLILAIFAEVFCAAGFIVGAFYRLALIPMIFTMCMAFLTVYKGTFSAAELPFAYLCIFVLMFFAGPGKFAFDRMIACRLSDEKR